jgi:diacylglycerol kinase (ATP)
VSGALAWAPPSADPLPRVRPAREIGRPIRAAVLSNPDGGFNRRRDHLDQARRAAATFDAVHVEASRPEEIIAAVRRFDAEGVELLVVNGGDGTVQMVLTALFADDRESAAPLLALVPGGTSNTIPGDVGWARRPPDGIRAALAAARRGRLEGHIARRPVLRVESPLWERPKCAMQFSAGAIYNAITFAKREIEGRGAHGAAGPLVTLAWFVITVLSGRAREIFPPMLVSGSIDGRPLRGGPHLGVLVSTLDHLFFGIRPFWGSGPGRLRYSALGYRPRRLALALWPLLRGRRGRFASPENGYTSCNGEHIELEIDAGFTLDGELFDAGPGTRMRIAAPATASFLRPGPG